MIILSGLTLFRVNEPISVKNGSTPGFDLYYLSSIKDSIETGITTEFWPGREIMYSYSTDGVRTLKLMMTKYVKGISYNFVDSVTFDVGYAPQFTLYVQPRDDISRSYAGNYVSAGVSFNVEVLQDPSANTPKQYLWYVGDAITYSDSSLDTQNMAYNTVGVKILGMTMSNRFGTGTNEISINCIDTPAMKIKVVPDNGQFRVNETITVNSEIVTENGHSISDIGTYFHIQGNSYSGSPFTISFGQTGTAGITLFYKSMILSGLSGTTYKEYSVLEDLTPYKIYVSGISGNDLWAGEFSYVNGSSGPVKTLEKATELAGSYEGIRDIEIQIEGGTYYYNDKSFYLTDRDNPNGKTLTYKPYSGQSVCISGGFTLSPSLFTLVTAGNTATFNLYDRLPTGATGFVYGADLSAYSVTFGISFGTTLPDSWNGRGIQNKYLPSIPDLYFNGNKMNLARWPDRKGSTGDSQNSFSYDTSAFIDSVVRSGSNSNNPPLGATTGIFKYSTSDSSVISTWNVTGPSSFDGIWLHGYWKWDWNDEVYKIKSINTSTREIEVYSANGVYGISKNNPCVSGGNPFVYASPTNRRWFAFNFIQGLGSTGEYYIDRENKKLYFWPPSPIGATSNIVLSSIKLAGDTTWVPGTPQFGDSVLQSQSQLNTNAVNASLFKFFGLKNVIIDGLEFHHMAGSGIEMTLCENVTVKNCKIYSPRKHGILVISGKNNTIDSCEIYYTGLKGVILTGGNRQTLTPANNILQNSKIIGSGRNTSSFGSCVQLAGVGNIVRKNIIANSGSFGMNLHGNDNIIEYNNFSNLVSEQDDSGGIYVANNVSDRNNIIRYNFFNNVKTQLPGGSAYSNDLPAGGCPSPPVATTLTSAIYIDEFNSGHRVESNVFFNCGSTYSKGGGGVFITHGLDNLIKNNIFVDCKNGVGHWYSTRQLWNTNDKALKSGENNAAVGTLQQIINIDNEPWYEEGSPPNGGPSPLALFGGRNYNPYSFFASGYGIEGTYRSTYGLLNKVNITSPTWISRYPELAGPNGMILYDSSIKTMQFNRDYIMKNYVNDNAFVNVTNKTIVTYNATSGSTFELGDYYEGTTYGIFVDKNSFNFKLTNLGLRTIQESVPNFEDIPFEEIPVL